METDRNTLDLDEELFEEAHEGISPARVRSPGVPAMTPELPIQPLVDRFEPRYRPLDSRRHPRALMVAALFLVVLVAFAGWYLGNEPAANGHASQAAKQNKSQ